MPSRHDSIAAFYAAKAAELQRAVRRAISGPDALIEDACSHAWCQLLRHDHVSLDDRGFSWLYVVAFREAYRMSDRSRREPALGEPADLPQRFGGVEDPAATAQHREEVEVRLGQLVELPPRQARMVFLQAAGFNYEEIARMTGDTVRTVERQLSRGRRTLRDRDRERAA